MTVIARRVASTPARSASQTWQIISTLLAPNQSNPSRGVFSAIAGIVSTLIADEAMSAPIVVHGCGPRVRIYCVYGDDALSGDSIQEDALAFDATAGDWHLSLPCLEEDLSWVISAIRRITTHVSVRNMTIGYDESAEMKEDLQLTPPSINKEAFLRP